MKEKDTTMLSGAYFIKAAGKIIAGGVFDVEPEPEKNGWAEHISNIPAEKLPEFTGSFTQKIEAEATILSIPKVPGVELILPPNTQLTAQMVREILLDIQREFAPKTIAVKPNPVKS